jgi:hypothetical protein
MRSTQPTPARWPARRAVARRSSLVAIALVSWLACDRGDGSGSAVREVDRPPPAPDAPTSTVPGAVSRYGVTLQFLVTPTTEQAAAFERARQRLESVIVGDLPDVTLDGASSCAGVAPQGTVDDLLVVVDLRPIDGPGKILGSAGPCIIRRSSSLTVVGVARFDTDDLVELEEQGDLDAVISHEMLHVVGVGSLWENLGLVGDASTDPHFVGSAARAAFRDVNGGDTYAGNPVPIEDTGGDGTAGAHWREDVLRDELMTGWLSGGAQPLSLTTVMSLADLGYEVDPASAEPFDIAVGLRALVSGGATSFGDDVLVLPLAAVE